MRAVYYAHSLEGQPVDCWELLEVHLRAVADLARSFANKWHAGDWGELAGLWHDLGKYRPEFVRRILGEQIHAPHAGVGAAMAMRQPTLEGLCLAFTIAGHHAGLANHVRAETGPTPLIEVVDEYADVLDRLLPSVDESIRSAQVPSLPRWLVEKLQKYDDDQSRRRQLAFFVRMLFSALVDADRLCTSEFYARAEGRLAPHQRLRYDPLAALLSRLDASIDRKTAVAEASQPTPMNALRRTVLDQCRAAAIQPPGIFSLTVPTGGGKTLSGMSFALRHAVHNKLERVIVVIPFTSIIEQNAERYRQAFGVDEQSPDRHNVLEHHSAVDRQKRHEENPELELRRQAAAENWDAPVVVTTSVQFFESLFTNDPSGSRKLHRVAGSVVVLDEVQTLPPILLAPILEYLEVLAADYRCSIVLSTATPPSLERRDGFDIGLGNVVPIVSNVRELFACAAARRVTVEWRTDKAASWDDLSQEIDREHQALAIVHRRNDARALYQLLKKPHRHHLSALMCPAHRVDRLNQIARALAANQPCRVVSTQLIEAGVDVDFPVVFRALAGLDSLAQSAGRCDREGRRTEAAGRPAGRFVVFLAPTTPPGETLRAAMEITQALLRLQHSEPELAGGLDLLNPDHATLFFQQFYGEVRWDPKNIRGALSELNFATAARDFQMIANDGMCSIVVPWGEGRERAERFRRTPSLETRRALQPFTVQVNRQFFRAIEQRGVIEVADGDSLGLPTSLMDGAWYGDEFGLATDPATTISPETLMV